MSDTQHSEATKPRDLYAVLALIASCVAVPMRTAAKHAADAWLLLRQQRRDIETVIALRAMSGTSSGWRATGRGLGLFVLMFAITFLLSTGILRSGFGVGSTGFIDAMQGPYGFLVTLITGFFSQLAQPHLWFGIILALLLRRYFASETWRSEIKVLPIPAHTILSRILALLFLVGVGFHVLAYAINGAYWLTVVFITNPGGVYHHFWQWGFLVGPLYADRRTASLLAILVNEPFGHLLGAAMSFLRLTVVITLALAWRNTIKAACVYALVSWLFWGIFYSALTPLHGRVRWLTTKFLPGDPGVMAGNILMYLIGFTLLLITLGITCRLLQRTILRMMEE